MAEFVVARKKNNTRPRDDRPKRRHPKMTIVAEGKTAFTVPYAPRNVTLDGVAATFTTVDRGGREPLLLRSGGGLPTITYELVFGYADRQVSVESELAELRALAASGRRMRVNLDPTTGMCLWRLTSFSQEVIDRQFGTNLPTRAICRLTFQKASDVVVGVGPASGGKGDKGGDNRPKFYIVRKGDTLAEIAIRFYGRESAWRKIADANKIRNPKDLKPGMKLKLP